MKKFLSILLVIAFILTFAAGCGSKANTDSDVTKIKIYTKDFESWANGYIEDRIDEFNESQDEIYVELKIYYDDQLYWQAITTGRENGTSPDIYLISYNTLVREKEANNIISIDKYLTEEQKSDISADVWKMVEIEDEHYAYPWYTEPSTLFYYRTDVLKKAGYDSAPKTFAELYDVCEKIAPTLSRGRYCLSLPVGQADLSWTTVGLQKNMTGGFVVSDDWMESRIDEAGFKEIAQFFYTCIKNGWAAPAALTTNGYGDNVISLADETAIMCWGGSWNISLLYEQYPEAVEFIGISTIPTKDGDDTKCTATNGGWTFGISAQSSQAKQDAAWKFIEWMAADDVARSAEYFKVEHMGKVPVRESVLNYMETAEYDIKPEWAETVTKVASYAVPEVRFPFDLSYAVAAMFETCILNTNKDFESVYAGALTTAKSTINAVMSRDSYGPNPYL